MNIEMDFNGLKRAILQSQGAFNNYVAWEMSELMSKADSASINDKLKLEALKKRFNIDDSFADKLLGVRGTVYSKCMPGNNIKMAGVEAMNDFLRP